MKTPAALAMLPLPSPSTPSFFSFTSSTLIYLVILSSIVLQPTLMFLQNNSIVHSHAHGVWDKRVDFTWDARQGTKREMRGVRQAGVRSWVLHTQVSKAETRNVMLVVIDPRVAKIAIAVTLEMSQEVLGYPGPRASRTDTPFLAPFLHPDMVALPAWRYGYLGRRKVGWACSSFRIGKILLILFTLL